MTTGSKLGLILGKWPAVVHSYNKLTRECYISVPTITDGSEDYLLAEIQYPIGDKSKEGEFCTDILLLAGDHVWIEFLGGDPRYPIITGQRNPQAANGTDWRRFHQANIELLAQQVINAIAGGVITIKSDAKVVIDAPLTHVLKNLLVDGTITGNAGIAINNSNGGGGGGGADFQVPFVRHNGVNIGDSHTHTEQGDGAEVSPPH